MKSICCAIFLCCVISNGFCQQQQSTYIQILGIAQDGGYPHAGCTKQCCAQVWEDDSLRKFVVSFALVDSISKKWWLFEATPDIKFQLHYFNNITNGYYKYLPDGIFITHAHIGHYSGLMQLGKEVMNTKDIPVFVLPRMKTFLESNGPWSQLVKINNISLKPLIEDSVLALTDGISIKPFTVPHRDEYSETAGFRITTNKKKYLFIPDIDKWEKWNNNIVDEVKSVDIALLDGTFYLADELPERKISEVPHPYISETVSLFSQEALLTKSRIFFIHLNHTNKLLWNEEAKKAFEKSGFHLAVQGQRL